ncbi:uncharacterized protein ASPGLDRAFT_23488 [Aspergillus glaucus CBS 516.65]|uniref:Uncharacterized protein n=1 Tax=Aspergillus glaucus CBS 516.65 TaxID=1160497 RepID=A0A1L9VU89_ASPGL|nr:hypothetical protein ASPGLDRAFT_23488 [Aspergillus glaucus CBS 516.65]OJJ87488.1 hypothetical protein ASPGLDRAFT_23488 [Aspergillus glaucus CBS 516.65]
MPLLPPPPPLPPAAPPGTYLVTLLIYPNHWAYYIPSFTHPNLGVLLHTIGGDTKTGFKFSIQRSYDLSLPENQNPPPTHRIPLQWVDERWFDEERMLNGGVCVEDWEPVCGFEGVVGRVGMTGWGEGLDDEGDKDWVIKVSEELVSSGVFGENVVNYLYTIRVAEWL